MYNSDNIRICHNGVKRRRRYIPNHFVRSNFVSNVADRVKGHRAKRLFNFNSKKINKQFDDEHSISEINSDEALIARALNMENRLKQLSDMQKSVDEKALAKDYDEQDYKRASAPIQQEVKQLRKGYARVSREVNLRQKKRNDFLKNPANKICYICGAKGHVSKDCTSEKKTKKRQQRALRYKQKLIKEGGFKLDLDKEYKRLNAKISELQETIIQLLERDTSVAAQHLSKETDGGKESQDTAQETVNSQPAEENDIVFGFKYIALARQLRKEKALEEKRYSLFLQNNYERTRKYFANKQETIWSVIAQSAVFYCVKAGCTIAFASMLLLLLCAVLAHVIDISKEAAKHMDTRHFFASNVNEEVVGWTSHNFFPNKSALLAILCGIGIIISALYKVICKVDGMVEWECLSNYREQLKAQGITQRLPYKVSQIGTADFSFTSMAAYQLSKHTTLAALTTMSVLIRICQATLLVLRDIFGLATHIYQAIIVGLLWRKILRKLFRPLVRCVGGVLYITIIVGVKTVRALMPLILLGIVIFAIKYLYVMAVSHMVYALAKPLNWVSQTEETVKATLASCLDSVSSSNCNMHLTSATHSFSSLTTIIYGLISRIKCVFKQG